MQRFLGCLHGDAFVRTEHEGRKRLRDLNSGERLLTRAADGRQLFSPVLAFLHRQPDLALTFVRLYWASNSSLAVTPNHLVFRIAESGLEAVFAAELRPGDQLVFVDGTQPWRGVRLERTEYFEARGAFAPLTEAGTVVADSVLVSSYAHVRSHRLAHAALLPLRLLAHVTGPSTDSGVGLSRYAQLLLWLGQRLLPSGLLFGT